MKSDIKYTWREKLYRHYTSNPVKAFKQFRLGAMLFFLGLVTVYSAYQLLSESLTQEIITLIGLVELGLGFLIAMLAQVRSLIGRFLAFFKEPKR